MALRNNFSTQLSDVERLKRIAARAGFVQTRGRSRGEGSIRQMLEALIAGEAAIVPRKPRRSRTDIEARLDALAMQGLIRRPARKGSLSPYQPVRVEGESASEMIIRERR